MSDEQGDLELREKFLVYLLFQSANHEWDSMRKLACDSTNKIKIEEYFTKLFPQPYNDEIIPINSHFFRTRQIKQNDKSQLGVNNIQTDEFKALQEECNEINAISNGITVSFSDFLLMKAIFNADKNNEFVHAIKSYLEKLKNIKFLGFDAKNSGLPPKNMRREGRLNTINDDFLYLSYEYETALAEMRPIIDQEYSVAECITTKEMKIVNLHELNNPNIELLTTFYTVSKKVSEPNTESNSQNECFYKITQMLSHFFKSRGYDGISFGSSILENGVNLILFYADNVKFIASKIFRIKSVKVESENVCAIDD